jgi:hypothetical protein
MPENSNRVNSSTDTSRITAFDNWVKSLSQSNSTFLEQNSVKMPRLNTILFACLSVIATRVCAFRQGPMTSARISNRQRTGSLNTATVLHESKYIDHDDDNLEARRSFLCKISLLPLAAMPSLAVNPRAAQASGGATAGGAYLLSAKKRYYERVKASVSGLLQSVDGLQKGDSKIADEYFASEADGSWKDLTSAGYLLSNAFRRSSSTAPDSLPAVKVCMVDEIIYFLVQM